MKDVQQTSLSVTYRTWRICDDLVWSAGGCVAEAGAGRAAPMA